MNDSKKYAFLMINYETPDLIKDIHNKIKDEELYIEEDNDDYGKETESHVTLSDCLENDVNLEQLKKHLKKLDEYKIFLSDISKFECEDYDVLKCSAKSFKLEETNKEIIENFITHSEHKDYKPHMTIAYMKHGMADKYLKTDLKRLDTLTPKEFHFSWWEDGKQKDKYFTI